MGGVRLDILAELVRVTARTSAVIFAVSLAAGAAELLWPRSLLARRGAGWKLLAALLVSHTIHFAFVGVLTVETGGQNIANRGGWLLTVVVGVLFYTVTVGALVLRRVSPLVRTVPKLAADAVLSTLVALAFLQVYVGRMGKAPLFAVLTVMLAGTLVAFLAAVATSIVGAPTSNVAGSI